MLEPRIRIRWHLAHAANDEGIPPRASARTASIDRIARSLLERIATGDESAFEAFYRLFSRRVCAFARRMANDAAAADEITSDTMYEVWRSAGRFRGDSQVSTWVLGIARNKALVALRGRQRHERYEGRDIDDFVDHLESAAPDGFSLLARRQTTDALQRCMEQLSARHRECLHLSYFEDLSMREIATLLGIPEGTVKSRLSHARAGLAALYNATAPHAAPSSADAP